MKGILLAIALAQAADVSTTIAAVRMGCREAVWPSVRSEVVGKTAATIGVAVTFPIVKKDHPKLAKTLAAVVIGSGVAAAGWNLHQMARGCR